MIDYSDFLTYIERSKLKPWGEMLPQQIANGLSTKRYGDLPDWLSALSSLPDVKPDSINLDNASIDIGAQQDLTEEQIEVINSAFKQLIPWRKGPYKLFDTLIDTEWRSDWKWDRLKPHIQDLTNRTILDVGCGNGYHMWRMLGEGARHIIGIDPSPRFVVQFYMLKHFIKAHIDNTYSIDIVPVGIEGLPANLEAFDTTFSMGVLYHRRSPMDHLRELKATLKPGGELVLETLVVKGEQGYCLVPEGRYAQMNNVWFLPSPATLLSWLRKCGFEDPKCVDENVTSLEEQRATEWMRFQSLSDFLDPEDETKTVEGHPAPTRAIFVARKPI